MANLRADNLTGTGGRNAIDGSVFFEGTNSYLTLASGEIISGTGFGTNDFTIEFWINQGVNASNYTGIFNLKASTTTDRFQVAFQSSTIQVYTDTSTWRDTGYAPVSGQWEHIAFVRNYSGNTLKMYANGEEKWSVSNTRDYDEAFETFIGLHSSAYGYLQGYISNLRVCTHLVYASNYFTPPTEKLTVVPNTVLLCCQDSDDPTQEATGKTITGVGGLDINETEYVTNGTFGGSGTSPGGSTYSPAWTAWGDTTTAQNGGLFIERTSTLTGVYQLLTPTGSIPKGQYRIRGQISNKTGPGSAIIRLSSASKGNGTIFFGSYGPGVVESTINYSGSGNLYLNLMLGNNTGSADFSNISFRQVYTADGSSNVLPPVGVDEGVVFEGETKHNTQSYMYFPTGDTSQRGRGTALYGGGYKTPNSITAIDYLSIQSGGLTEEWGNLSTTQLASGASLSSSSRWVSAGGWTGANNNAIEYVEFPTQGNSIEFGELVVGRRNTAAVSNSTRGIWGGGYVSPADAGTPKMDYITIATKGDAADFGDLSGNSKSGTATGSTTRGVFALGNVAPTHVSTLEYVEIATLSDYTNFGDLTSARTSTGSCSSNVRGIYSGGGYPTSVNIIDYITIATTGNATDFGDLFLARGQIGGTSNGTRGVFMGGTTNPARVDNIDSVIIATTGNAVNWGNFRTAKQGLNSAASDSHGGL